MSVTPADLTGTERAVLLVADFRRPMPAWQISLADGTHVYIGRDTGEVEAVRTPFWRFYGVPGDTTP